MVTTMFCLITCFKIILNFYKKEKKSNVFFFLCHSAMCQLKRDTNACYVASCQASCEDSCTNGSQTNCSVNCCNFTGCLNDTFASMMMTTTTGEQTLTPLRLHDSHKLQCAFQMLSLKFVSF